VLQACLFVWRPNWQSWAFRLFLLAHACSLQQPARQETIGLLLRSPAGKEQSVRIQSSGGLSEDAIQQMVRDAESHAEKDKKRKEMIDVRSAAAWSRRRCRVAC
jgi:hypothetical protein